MSTGREIGGESTGAIFWRTSRDEQLTLSPRTQITEARKLLSHCHVPDEYVLGSDWSSPEIAGCPEYQQLFRLVEQGLVQHVAVYNPDRLAAKPVERLIFREACGSNGVTLHTVEGEFMGGETGELVEFADAWAKHKAVMRAQTGAKAGLRDRAKLDGLMPGGNPPFGLKYATKLDANGLTVKDATRVIASDDWHIMARIFRLYLYEGLAMAPIAKELEADGIPSPKGNARWDPSSLSGFLRNPMFGGKAFGLRHRAIQPEKRTGRTYGKSSSEMTAQEDWVELPNVTIEAPIVSWSEFEAIQERLVNNKKFSPKNAKYLRLLRGLIMCEVHDKPFHAASYRGGATKFVYLCGAYAHGRPQKACKRSIWGPTIDRHVWDRAENIIRNPEVIEAEYQRQGAIREDSEELLREALQRVDKKLLALRHKETKLVEERISEDGLDDEIYNRLKKMHKAERTWCEEETLRLHGQLEAIRERVISRDALELLRESVGNDLAGYTLTDKRLILDGLETLVSVSIDGRKQITFGVPEEVQPLLTDPGVCQQKIPLVYAVER